MTKNIAIACLSALCIALVVLAVLLRGDTEEQEPQVVGHVVTETAAPAVQAEKLARLEKQLADQTAELARLRAKLTAPDAPSSTDLVVDDILPGDVAVAAVSNEVVKGITDAVQQIMSAFGGTNGLQGMVGDAIMGRNPGVTRKQRIAMYDELVERLGLDDEKATAFRSLLEKRLGSSGIKLNINGMDAEAISLGDLLGGGAAHDDDIRELLGEDGFAEYERFAEKDSARVMVGEFNSFMGEDNLSLTTEQRERLTDMFHQAKLADPTGQDLEDGLSFQLEENSSLDTEVDQSLDSLVTRYDALAESATDVLSSQQSEQFRSYLDGKLAQKEMEGDLARKLLSNSQMMKGVPGADVRGSVKVVSPGISVGVISGGSSEMTIGLGADDEKEKTP